MCGGRLSLSKRRFLVVGHLLPGCLLLVVVKCLLVVGWRLLLVKYLLAGCLLVVGRLLVGSGGGGLQLGGGGRLCRDRIPE
jgi:hypothetical protein